MKYYSLKNIQQKNSHYNIIIGERSNGKTYAVLDLILQTYIQTGKQGAILRRFSDDFIGKRGQMMFASLVENNLVSKYTNSEYNSIKYYASRWYLCFIENGKITKTDENPFCFGFSISSQEHDKSTSYPNITTILFDEFLTRNTYLTDEFILFMNTCSTIIRERSDVKIYMLGNTVNKYCPYFNEMGLAHIKEMQQGDIDIYTYGSSNLKVAVEYCHPADKKGKKSDIYFAFDNPKLQMIKSGSWEIDIYPHCPCKYKPADVVFSYFIIFEDDILQCDIVILNDREFTFIHRKTTPIKDESKDLIFCTFYDSRPNFRMNILKPFDKIGKKIYEYFVKEKIFYQDNEVGEIVRNFLKNK